MNTILETREAHFFRWSADAQIRTKDREPCINTLSPPDEVFNAFRAVDGFRLPGQVNDAWKSYLQHKFRYLLHRARGGNAENFTWPAGTVQCPDLKRTIKMWDEA